MNKKGSMELSVNSIVILVIAIVIMGLILGFIRSKFSEVGGNLVTNEPDPQTASSDDRITLSRETISVIPGSQAVLKVNIFNPTAGDYTNAKPLILCTGVNSLINTTNAKTIASGTQVPYIISLSVPKAEGRGKSALCSVTTTGTATTSSVCGVGTGGVTCTRNTVAIGCTCTGTGCTATPTCPSGFTMISATGPNTNCACSAQVSAGDTSVMPIPAKDFVLQIN